MTKKMENDFKNRFLLLGYGLGGVLRQRGLCQYLPVHPLVIFTVCLLMWPPVLLLSHGFFRFIETPSINLGKWLVKTHLTRAVQAKA